nr:hypothetical protein BaRGS_016734 [Batillaria attramentaria]
MNVPAKLSKISILNAIRSGTYVVNEPPAPPTNNDNNIREDDDNNPAAAAEGDNAKMTDNGVVANEDNTQVSLMKMPEETLPEPEVMSELPPSPTKKPHSIHSYGEAVLYTKLSIIIIIIIIILTNVKMQRLLHARGIYPRQ